MTTKYDDVSNRYSPTGYEGQNYTETYTIPSCGLEDLDKAVFNLFDKQIPLYFTLEGENKKVPVIFATGERYALLRRKKPIIDRTGALILPLISITRSGVDSTNKKGGSNNEMFTHVLKKRISEKDIVHRQLKNFENLENVNTSSVKDKEKDFTLKNSLSKNLIETIEIPPIKYFTANYDITIWSSFTQQMNDFLEVIINSYTINPARSLRIESDNGYWFTAHIDQSFSQDTNYSDYTDAERYMKYSIKLEAAGYIIKPNIKNGKVALRSMISCPTVNFEVMTDYHDVDPTTIGVQDPDPDANVFDDLRTEDGYVPSKMIGVNSLKNAQELEKHDKTKGYSSNQQSEKYKSELVGVRGSDYKKERKTFVKNSKGELIPVIAKASSSQGETLYDSRLGEVLFNISNED